jgi:hypothetical protein
MRWTPSIEEFVGRHVGRERRLAETNTCANIPDFVALQRATAFHGATG